ncbi:MAG: SAM-dependent methyltransferase, partial [Proteobacteria bacterium]|nr:SAM-dependent methyltransferase [Pseudomonadota bacterium]
MDRDTRNAIERATQRARKALEEDFASQLEGNFDVHRDGVVAATAGTHLSARQAFARERIVAAIEHKRAAGMSQADAARDYLRDAAFTTLNRFVALKMLEARELVQECITKGEQSGGYREFCGMAPGLPLLPESAGYRLYIESLFDELSTEVKVLFDRRDASSVLWPKRGTFEQLLEILNATELVRVWGEDETIGWVYQFFNGQDERRKMREESQAPRNSRELAVRNQFFTPRYVVQFLTDNTLGRIWYEMRGTKTALADKCGYMVRNRSEEFAPRAKKDPRDLRVLDPACGSGHFLLYAFDLLFAIYEEGWEDADAPKSEATGKTLAEDYAS